MACGLQDTYRAFPLPERVPPTAAKARPQMPFEGTSSYTVSPHTCLQVCLPDLGPPRAGGGGGGGGLQSIGSGTGMRP